MWPWDGGHGSSRRSCQIQPQHQQPPSQCLAPLCPASIVTAFKGPWGPMGQGLWSPGWQAEVSLGWQAGVWMILEWLPRRHLPQHSGRTRLPSPAWVLPATSGRSARAGQQYPSPGPKHSSLAFHPWPPSDPGPIPFTGPVLPARCPAPSIHGPLCICRRSCGFCVKAKAPVVPTRSEYPVPYDPSTSLQPNPWLSLLQPLGHQVPQTSGPLGPTSLSFRSQLQSARLGLPP